MRYMRLEATAAADIIAITERRRRWKKLNGVCVSVGWGTCRKSRNMVRVREKKVTN